MNLKTKPLTVNSTVPAVLGKQAQQATKYLNQKNIINHYICKTTN